MVKYLSSKLKQTAVIKSFDSNTNTVIYETADGKTHSEKYDNFIKVFNGIINSMQYY